MTVSVVTGSSTGIGYATALELAELGHTVVAAMRTPDACDLATVAADRGLAIELRRLDVDDPVSIESFFADVHAAHGTPDVLVNNAGVGSDGALEDTSIDHYRAVMETNFFGALACMKAVLPGMRERESGCIVNVTSQAGRIAFPGMSAYCASKWALEAATESMASEVARFGIRVALIEPGAIMTAIWGKVDMTPPAGPYASLRKRLGKVTMTELGHASSADEVADCIVEAITTETPRLRWLTGQGAGAQHRQPRRHDR